MLCERKQGVNTSKFLFHYLSLLNIVDGVLTYWGLEQSLISELIPIMNQVYQWSPFLFIILKLFLSICLYLFIILKITPQTLLVKGLMLIAVSFYTFVFFLHYDWIANSIL